MPPNDDTHAHHHIAGHEVHVHQPDSPLRSELVSHMPFSVASVALGLALAGLICFMAPVGAPSGAATDAATRLSADQPAPGTSTDDHDHQPVPPDIAGDSHVSRHLHGVGFQPLFHLFHPLHMLFSAAATTAMFWRYDKRLIRAILVGFSGAVVICGISDILIPHVALLLLHKHLHLHICIVEHPALVLPFAMVGVAVGLFAAQGVMQSTYFSHSLHVFTSTMASIFYMVAAYGRVAWIDDLGWIFGFVLIAVMGPCCFSDIIFPVAMSRPARQAYSQTSCCH